MTKTALAVAGTAFELYETQVNPMRARFARESTLALVLDPAINPDLLELFLIHFNALSVAMTEPVENWVRRAGDRCIEIGLKETGLALRAHAKQEAGHHLMMIADTRTLVSRWNARHTVQLNRMQLTPLRSRSRS